MNVPTKGRKLDTLLAMGQISMDLRTFMTSTICTPASSQPETPSGSKLRPTSTRRTTPTSDVYNARIIDELPGNMIDGHVTHQEHESNPWHERAIDITSDEVGPSRADQDRSDARPKIEKTYKIENRNAEVW